MTIKYTAKQLQSMSSKDLLKVAKEIGSEYYSTLPYFKTKEEGQRALETLLSQNRSNASLIKDITSMQKNLKTTTKVVEKTDKLVSNISKQKSELINSFANYTSKSVAQNYAESQKQLKAIIDKHLAKNEWTITEMKKFERDTQLYNEINSQLDKLGMKTEQLLTNNINIAVKDTVLNDAYFVEQFSKKTANLTVLNSSKINELIKQPWSGLPYSDRIWKDTNQMKYILKDQLMQSMILGENPKKLAKRLNDVMGKGAYNATRLARTEVISAGARAQTQFAKDNSDIIAGMKWVAYIDKRTSKQCLAHDGEIKTEEEWDNADHQIPCHPNCRCSYTMEVKDEFKVDKKVQPFDEWVKEKRANGQIVDGEGYMKPKTPVASKTPTPTPTPTVKAPTTVKKLGSEYTKQYEAQVNSLSKTKDVQSFMQKEFPHLNINLGRMDINSAKRTSLAMAEMKDRFPYVSKEYLNNFGSFTHYKNLGGSPPNSSYCSAFYGTSSWKRGNGIYFNSKSWDEIVKNHTRGVASQWEVPSIDAGKSTIYHEFGHTLVDYIQHEHKDVFKQLQDEWYTFNRQSSEEMKEALSKYGASDFDEFCAEAFSEYIGNEKPRPTAEKVGSLIMSVAK